MTARALLLTLAAVTAPHAVTAHATAAPTGALRAGDPRMREAAYAPQAVTTLNGCFGFQSTVAFEPGERIENVAMGDAKLWDVTPNKRADLLFLKPSVHTGRTNMMVVTDRRRYAFDLIAHDDAACHAGRVLYELQFTYPANAEPPPNPAALAALAAAAAAAPPPAPAPAADAMPPPAARNTAYTFTGTAANVPERVFDDGHSTWLRWAPGTSTPAIYALAPDKTESLLNYTIKGDYLVVDGVGPAYVLRRGSAVAVLYNDAYQKPNLDADAPRPRGQAQAARRRPSLLARLFTPSHPNVGPVQTPTQSSDQTPETGR